jgi:hypothetical protein
MPTIPSVFRNIRKNDVHQRPFKAYKNYVVTNIDAVAEKNGVQRAIHKKVTPHVNDATYNYPLNSTDNTNQHVVWNWIDHRYYRYPYDQARCHELTNENNTEKFLFWNASVITVPYHQMGERIKPATTLLQSFVTASSTNKFNANFEITASDDSYGNLRDIKITSQSFASSSYNPFYFTFNNEFRKFDDNYGTIKSNMITYKLRKLNKRSTVSNIRIDPGIDMFISGSVYASSGLAGHFTSSLNSYIKIPHDDTFNEMQRCDDWGFSIWFNPDNLTSTSSIFSKYANITEAYYDQRAGQQKIREANKPIIKPGTDFSKKRTPMQLSLIGDEIHYQASDGSIQLHISASTSYRGDWSHLFIQNSNNVCKLYINGVASGTSGSIPRGSTANSSNILLGRDTLNLTTGNQFNGSLAELRMYNYALTQAEIESLADIDFYTGSLYQTNVMGNVFYKNGQIVISSPLPKHQDVLFTGSFDTNATSTDGSPSGLPNSFDLKYKGQYTIYENECMVRIPMNSFNVTTNPSATYRPATGVDNSCNDVGGGAESFNSPGDYRKTMFITGSAKPYITTVGLYNDKSQLLAVGKLAEPLEKREDIDMNIIIRWDF